MRCKLTKIAQAATLGLAITFTFSCSSDSDEKPNGYCVYEATQKCFESNSRFCAAGGEFSSFCPFYDNPSSSSSVTAKSSSSTKQSSSSVVYSSSNTAAPSSSSVAPSSSSAEPSSPSSSSVNENMFTDSRDSTIYKWVKIGRTWMAENLNYAAEGSKCYRNDEANCAIYGRLYNWATAMEACPAGWHLPSDYEWNTLMSVVGGTSVAGTKLKAASGWNNNGNGTDDYNGNGTDDYGFAALPGGGGNPSGTFYSFGDVGTHGNWWSSTEGGPYVSPNVPYPYAYRLEMGYNHAAVSRELYDKTNGLFSVRCIQD